MCDEKFMCEAENTDAYIRAIFQLRAEMPHSRYKADFTQKL